MADEDDRGAEIGVQPAQQVEDLRLDRDVERRRRLVGDQQRGLVREPHREHDALAHPARELVRIGAHRALRAGDPHALQQRDRALAGAFLREPPMRRHRLDELAQDAQHRVERGHRVLEDHRDLGAAHLAHGALRQLREIAPAEADAAADDARGLFEQAHHGFRRHALARTGFAHDPERLAAREPEAHAIDGAHRAGIAEEPGAEVLHLQDGISVVAHAGRASRGCRRPRN